MNTSKNYLGKTYLTRSYPWGLHPRNGHRLLCADGIIRAAELAETADTFFSIPASVRINGKRVSGYATTGSIDDLSSSPAVAWTFRPHTGQDAPYWPSYENEAGDDVSAKYDAMRSKTNAILAKAV